MPKRIQNRFCRFALFAVALIFLGSGLAPGRELRGSGPELDQNLPEGHRRLQIGDAAPDFLLKGVDEREYRLADFAKHRFLLVVFLSNHCPFSHAAETRMLPWIERMRSHGLGVVAVQPNHPDSLTVDELGYSKYNDSFDEMKLYAAENHFSFPYLYDGDNQEAAKRYGALATPDLFLFDEQRRLVYSGRFDDSRFESADTVTSHDAIRAFDAVLAGVVPEVPTTRPMGCSVKWRSKAEHAAEANIGSWAHAPIVVEPIGPAGAAALVKNQTKKLRLINVWATWCGPCVAEMPEFARLARRLKNRDFELVTISVDQPRDLEKAQKFLASRHVGTPDRIQKTLTTEGRSSNHYLYVGARTDELAQALDPSWPGPVPYTLLVAPGGEILWRQGGRVDATALSRRILDQLGGFYPEE